MTHSPAAARQPYAVVGGRILRSGALRRETLVIEGTRISEIVAKDAALGGLAVVDARDAIVAPGLIDAHVHGALGRNLMEGNAEAVGVVADRLSATGVTAFVGATASVDFTEMLDAATRLGRLTREAAAEGHAALLGIHLEGPFLSPDKAGVHRQSALVAPTIERIDAVVAAAAGALRICTIAPELDGGLAAIERLVEAGTLASVGHTNADYRTTTQAIDAGARRATHLFNAMPSIHHRQPGPVPALLADDRVHVELVADGEHLAPDLLAWLFAVPSFVERLTLVSDGSDISGLPDGPQRRWEGTPVVVEDGRSLTLDGHLAGSTATLLDGVRTLVKAGVGIEAALSAASTAPAVSLGLGDRGVLEPGAIADILVLTDDLELQQVVVRGSLTPPRPVG